MHAPFIQCGEPMHAGSSISEVSDSKSEMQCKFYGTVLNRDATVMEGMHCNSICSLDLI